MLESSQCRIGICMSTHDEGDGRFGQSRKLFKQPKAIAIWHYQIRQYAIEATFPQFNPSRMATFHKHDFQTETLQMQREHGADMRLIVYHKDGWIRHD